MGQVLLRRRLVVPGVPTESPERWTAVRPSAAKKQAARGSTRTPTGAPIGAVHPRSARTQTRASPMRTSTKTSSPSGSTT